MEFIVEADPRGKESVRVSGRHAFIPEKTRIFMGIVRNAFLQEVNETPLDYSPHGYISMRIDAYFPIPQSWPKRKKAAARSGDLYPDKKPDVDNIQKAVLDALTGVAYEDDKQVVRILVNKRYAEHGFLRIWIGELKP